jgi:hypothetical protein
MYDPKNPKLVKAAKRGDSAIEILIHKKERRDDWHWTVMYWLDRRRCHHSDSSSCRKQIEERSE